MRSHEFIDRGGRHVRLTGASRRRMLPRFALVGLVLGFVTLAVGGLVAASTTQRAIQTVEASDKVNAAWYNTFVFLNQETEAMNDYLRAPDEGQLQVLRSNVGSAQPTINWLQVNVDVSSVRRAVLIKQGYEDFTLTLKDLIAEGHAGHRAEAGELGRQAAMSAAGLRKLLSSIMTVQRSQMRLDLDTVGKDNQRLHDVGIYVIAVDAVLLVICAVMLIGYQRRVERHAASSRHQARHDALTGLANRRLLDDEMHRALRDAADTGELAGLLLIDLDGFKAVNDTYGHQAGDLLLQEVATRLTAAVRRTDLVARLGGDEFAVLLPSMQSTEQVGAIASTILRELARPIDLPGCAATVSGSIGVALCPDDATDHQDLFRLADAAMYTAKRGRLGVVFHRDTQPSVRPEEFELSN